MPMAMSASIPAGKPTEKPVAPRCQRRSRFAEHGIEENERVHLRALDVTDADQRRAIGDEAESYWQGVQIFVNNAEIA